jgi:CheY-like chemotaxis protein
LAYLFLNVIVLLYFTQSRVRTQFHSEKYDAWNRSILVVDDDGMIGKTVRPILFSKGFSVLTAASGEDGLQIARTQKPDLILLDVILPGLKGREVCAKLKEDPQTKEIPVVFLTSKDSPEDIRAENEVGSSGHLTKPVNAKTLIDMVQGILGPGKIRKK